LINPQLPVAELKNRFARDGRIVIDDVLDPAAAEALYQCLLRDVPWEIVFRRGAQVITLTQRDLERLPQRELDQLMAGVQRQAQTEFQFVYWKFSMVDAYRRQLMPQLLTHRLLESLYRPGNFLTEHTDDHDDAFVRRAAYVIQLCKDWKADWGGLLHFLDARGEVTRTFVPRFNSMALFAVPQPHVVSMVVPFAPGPRFGVTGWFTS
jgi:Rps23 Pro-64 3,4-dihydroxylase Tpa1-like proline 4-hydroxylase